MCLVDDYGSDMAFCAQARRSQNNDARVASFEASSMPNRGVF